jgi:hypothetical protein
MTRDAHLAGWRREREEIRKRDKSSVKVSVEIIVVCAWWMAVILARFSRHNCGVFVGMEEMTKPKIHPHHLEAIASKTYTHKKKREDEKEEKIPRSKSLS